MSPALLLLLSTAFLFCMSIPSHELDFKQGNHSCSMPWFVWKNNSCKCGSSLGGIVTCRDDPVEVHVKSCYCMTNDKHTGETVVGNCPYACAVKQQWYMNKTELDYHTCEEIWKRTDTLCSQCLDGFGPPVRSYSMQCVPCSPKVVRDSNLILLVSFLPLTFFCLTIITLRISVARPPMSTFVLVSQVMASPQYLSLLFAPGQDKSVASPYAAEQQRSICWKLFASFFGIWNMDMFRSFYPQMCLSPHISTMQAKMFEYLIALFPLAILCLVYALVNVYYRYGYRIIACVCRPVVFGLSRLIQTIDIKTSLVDAFATFIILSVIKTGYTSFIILQPVNIFTPDGNYTTTAYADPLLTYFGWDHLPYALTALVLSFVFILIPLLLLFLYPLRLFQTFLNNRQWQCTTLHIFADSFQGCYKDGTNGTRDYRWFAGLHLILRFILVVFHDASHYQGPSIFLRTIATSFYMALLAVCQPYKKYLYLKIDMMLLFGLQLWNIDMLVFAFGYDYSFSGFVFHLIILILATLIPFLYIVGLVVYWLIFLNKLHVRIMNKFMAVSCCRDQTSHLLNNSV